MMNSLASPASLNGGQSNYVRRERFEVNQYVRVHLSDSRYSIGIVTAIDEDNNKATVETRNGYDVTRPISALRRAFLVVLDLNGVLVARGRGSFILRPHVVEFLKFVFSNFVVAVWTSGLQRSSNPIIEHVFGTYRDRLLFSFFRESCVPKASPENPYGTEKNLQLIFDRYPLSFHAVNTIIIDDSPDKCSHPDIALCPVPFKDPVAQSQDTGLLETMETLQQVLLLDSGAPLIAAAEERLRRLAEQQQQQQQEKSEQPLPITTTNSGASPASAASGPGESAPSTSGSAAASAVAFPTSLEHGAKASTEHETVLNMEEVELWKTRLCCENLLGKCPRGASCPFSHDADDGRPCSRKSHCSHHGSRWPKTVEETAQEARKREAREAKQRQYALELEQRQQKPQLHLRGGNARGQVRRHTDSSAVQTPQPQHQQQHQPRGGGGGGGGRQRDYAHRGSRRGGSLEEGADDYDDWAAAPTGLSHTGDPAYDNMINEQQQQQQRRHAASRNPNEALFSASAPCRPANAAPSLSMSTAAGSRGGGGGGGGGAHENLSSGYRRQLMQHHHSQPGGLQQAQSHIPLPQSAQQQQQQQSWAPRTDGAAPFFFQSSTAVSPSTTIEPFSTRPITQPATAATPQFSVSSIKLAGHVQQPQQQPPQQPSSFTINTVSSSGAGSGGLTNARYGESTRQTRQQQQQRPSVSSMDQSHAAIRISGKPGDSNAVVNQLQALMRKN